MYLGRDVEHGGYPTSDTRTISQMRRDADLYSGIGRRKSLVQARKSNASEPQKVVDTAATDEVRSIQPHDEAPETKPQEQNIMELTFKSLSKNGKNAFYGGAATVIRIALSAFPDKQAPAVIDVNDGVFAPAKQPKVRETKEERKARLAAQPKPTEAEKIARAEAALAKRKAKLAGDAPEL